MTSEVNRLWFSLGEDARRLIGIAQSLRGANEPNPL